MKQNKNYDYITIIRHGGMMCVAGHADSFEKLSRHHNIRTQYSGGKGAPRYMQVYKLVKEETNETTTG